MDIRAGSAALVIVLSLTAWSEALVVKTWDGAGTPALVNDSAPADDPGWANLPTNRSAIYLGNQWVLTAQHNHSSGGVVDLAGSSFPIISSNFSQRLTNPSTFAGRSIDANSDLLIYRIGLDENGMSPEELDPNIRQIQIASSLPSVSTDLTIFGSGRQRIVNTANDATGQFFFTSSGGMTSEAAASYRGFDVDSGASGVWQWGTNRRAPANSISGIVRSGANVLINASGPGATVNDTVGFPVRFDEFGLDDEAQAQSGDSGGPVFWKEEGEWVLGGLMHVIYPANNTQSLSGAFGSHTVISDLSYNEYATQLSALLAESRYANMGDIDMDGAITGEIVNGVATGDLGILIDNWFYQASEANVQSWVRGDLNQDAVVDLADFALMRDALGGTISTQEFAALVAGFTIPEPTAAGLAAGALLAALARRRR